MKQLCELVVELSDRCPMHCRHCSSMSGPSCKHTLRRELVMGILDEAVSLRTQQVSFGGGEPTIALHFMEAVERSTQNGLSTEVYTCGVTLSKRNKPTPFSDALVDNLANLGERLTLVFSLHGSHAKIHDSITGVEGSFGILAESLGKCLAHGIRCSANFVPTRLNVADLPEIADLLVSVGVPKLSILRFVPQGRGHTNRGALELSQAEEEECVRKIMALRSRGQILIRTGSPFNGIIPGNNVPCRAGFQKLVIQPDGNVLPCEVFKSEERRDWGSSVYRMNLKEILNAPQFLSQCRSLLTNCATVCPVHSILRPFQYTAEAFHEVS